MSYLSLDEITEKLDFFKKMYDAVRLVDPMQKKVVDCRNSIGAETEEICYAYWGNGKICDNCVSIRAYHENRSFVKLEKSEKAILLVTAVPVDHTEKPIVLELLKNATETMIIGSGNYESGIPFCRFVQEMNDTIIRDSLTALYNRRFLDERLPADIVEATLKNQPLSICFMDLDNFKLVNDLYGHERGDLAIKAIGEIILKNIRLDRDWAARYGGDEFVLCLHNADGPQARAVASRIQALAEQRFREMPVGKIRLSLSFGIETMKGTPMTAAQLIRGADQKMYREKRGKYSRTDAYGDPDSGASNS
ncbi:MAG: GGDEF domain-containing protein [Clostridiaceae bacterium]|nr:GGDEF domain-containing protein [Clostridiaceae bacterium]